MRSGVRSMPYRDYCVTILDKVQGNFRSGDLMPDRILKNYDVLVHAYKDRFDTYAANPALPERLDLWDEVTAPGRYFDLDSLSTGPGGFTYVEVYDPGYWMFLKGAQHQDCFHPMYRMRAKSEASVLNDCTVAMWITKYADVVPEVTAGAARAAPSVHFGMPLWFFRHSTVDSIARVVFATWGVGNDL